MKQQTQENKVHPVPRLSRLTRRPSLNTSVSSTESLLLVKKKFALGVKQAAGLLTQKKPQLADNISNKLKVCQGERLSYDVMRSESREKKAEFLQKYTHDPFMKLKFQKSVQKFNRSKSRQALQNQMSSTATIYQPKKDIVAKKYTTFRQQIRQQSQKTVKLINNCKQLVEELKKNRLVVDLHQQEKDGFNKLEYNDQKSLYIPSKFNTKKYNNNPGALTDRV